MPEPLQFEFSRRARDVKNPRSAEILMRELEDYLNRLHRESGGGSSIQAGARWESNPSEDVFFGSLQNFDVGPFPIAWSLDYNVHVQSGLGETPERTVIHTPGFWTFTLTVYGPNGADFLARVSAFTAESSGEASGSEFVGWSSGDGTESSATAFTSWAMADGDYFLAQVKGPVDEPFHGFITAEYVAPYGGEFVVPEG